MEYTKDLILNVSCKDIRRGFCNNKQTWTSIITQKIKRHKIVLLTVISAVMFITIDMILLSNFINLITKL